MSNVCTVKQSVTQRRSREILGTTVIYSVSISVPNYMGAGLGEGW